MAVEVVGALVATYAVKGLGGIHALAGAVLGATVVSQIAQAAITVPVESRLEDLRDSLLDDDEEERSRTAVSVGASATAAGVTSSVSDGASPPPPTPAELTSRPGPEARSGSRRVLTTGLAAASALVATLIVVFGVTAIEIGSGNSVIASGDRATTFFSPRDTSPPTRVEGPDAKGRQIELRYDEQLRAKRIEGPAGFSLGASESRIERVSMSGDLVVLELAAEVTEDSRLSLTYRGESVVDEAGNLAESFRGVPVGITPRPPGPLALRATEGSGELVLPFDEPLAPADSAELVAAMTVTVGETVVTPTAAAIVDDRLLLTLPDSLVAESVVVVAYEPGDAAPLRDVPGNPVGSFERKAEALPDTTPPTLARVETGDQALEVVFDEPLDEDPAYAPDPATFLVTLTETDVVVTAAAASGNTIVLELAEPLAAGVEGNVEYTGETLRDLAGNLVASGQSSTFAVPAAQRPVFQRAEFLPGENVVVLVYDVALDTSSPPESSSFAIGLPLGKFTPSVVAYDASATEVRLQLDAQLALVLEQALAAEEDASIAYAPGESPITSSEGAEAEALEPQPISVAD